MNGILLIDKPLNWTSQDVVTKIKRILKVKKIGHAGTLDPLATGLLVVLIGDATKLSNYLLEEDKKYEAQILIGVSTTTEDAEGQIVDVKAVDKLDDVDDVLLSLIGNLEQVPPMFSAIKQDGKKLYDLARQGINVERKSRTVKIFNLQRTSEIYYHDNEAEFCVTTHVSKGTYIRSLAVEIGSRLEYPAHLKALRRISSGNMNVEDSYTIEDVQNGNFQLIPLLKALNLPEIVLDEELYKKVTNGMTVKLVNTNEEIVKMSYNNELVAIYQKSGQYYKAARVWN